MRVEPKVDVLALDLERPRWDLAAVRARLPHRFEMEQLSGVLEVDADRGWVVGFRRYTEDDHWVRGHIPGSPILPGVLMVEAAAQLGTFYCHTVLGDEGFWALAGVDGVRFREAVKPGDTVVYACEMLKVRARIMRLEFQAIKVTPAGGVVACDGQMTGVHTDSLVER